MLTNRSNLLLTASVICFAGGGPAFAQLAPDGTATASGVPQAAQASPAQGDRMLSADGGQDIIVTAQKREQRLNDVPISITAVSGEQLSRSGITSTADLAKISPGFTYQESQYGTPVFGIRGISFFDFSTASSPAVSVSVDQVPLPLSILSSGALLDVERAEVLKGPQGTLFGQNSTGGAVNYIAAKPTKEFSAGLNATYARFNQKKLDGFASIPITNTLGIRVAMQAEDRGDHQYSVTRDDTAGQRSFWAGRVIVAWKPTDAIRFELNANGWLDNSDSTVQQFKGLFPQFTDRKPSVEAALAAQPLPPLNNRAGDWDPGFNLKRNNRFQQIALRADIDLTSDITLTSLSSYIRFEGLIPTDNDGSSTLNIRTRSLPDFKIFNQELRLAGSLADIRWMIGGNYEDSKLNETLSQEYDSTNSVFAPGAFFDAFKIVNDQRVKTKAVFGSLEYEITPRLSVQGSARYTKQTRDFSGCTADPGTGVAAGGFSFLSTALRSGAPGFDGVPTVIAPGQCVTLGDDLRPVQNVTTDLDEDNTSWRGSISYKPTNDSLIYANVTKGYKAGSFTPGPFIRTSQITRVKQESVLAYEAGFKANIARAANITGAAFYYDYHDKQITGFVDVFALGILPASVNVPRSSIRGAELAVELRPLTGLRLNASGTYVDSKVDRSFVTATPLGRIIDLKGEQLPNAPKWQFNADAEYRHDLGGDIQAFVGAAISYRSKSFALFGAEPQFAIPGYALVDLRAGADFAQGRWRAEVFGRNITNKYYLTNVSRSIDAVTAVTGMPATYGITLGFRY